MTDKLRAGKAKPPTYKLIVIFYHLGSPAWLQDKSYEAKLPAYARPADAPPDHYELKYLVRPGNRPKPVLVQHASQPGEDLPVGAAHPYPSRQIFNVCAASVGEEALKKSSGSNSLMVTLRPQLGRRASALPLAGTVGVLSARVRFQEGKVLSDVQNTDWLPVQLTPRSALAAGTPQGKLQVRLHGWTGSGWTDPGSYKPEGLRCGTQEQLRYHPCQYVVTTWTFVGLLENPAARKLAMSDYLATEGEVICTFLPPPNDGRDHGSTKKAKLTSSELDEVSQAASGSRAWACLAQYLRCALAPDFLRQYTFGVDLVPCLSDREIDAPEVVYLADGLLPSAGEERLMQAPAWRVLESGVAGAGAVPA
eukprot:g75557.t1